jgi:hypothetical protein
MKKTIFISVLFLSIAMFSCGQKKAETSAPAATTLSTEQPTTKVVMYQCPMKDTPADDKAGKCSKCGMDKIELK